MTKSEQSNIYFGYDECSDNPVDGLHSCAAVLDTLSRLISSCDDLHLLERTNSGDGLHGLSVIISSVNRGIMAASDEITLTKKSIINDYMVKLGAPFEAMGDANMQRAWKDGFKHGRQDNGSVQSEHFIQTFANDPNFIGPLAVPFYEFFNSDQKVNEQNPDEKPTPKHVEVREKLIAASYKEGNSIIDISQAINIRKQHIEKVLLGLAMKGELPLREEDEKALAANQ